MTWGRAAEHRPFEEIDARHVALSAMPRTQRGLDLIVLRTAKNERSTPLFAELDAERGLVGDRWFGSGRTPDAQVTLMDVRAAAAIAERVNWPLFGDNLIVDMDFAAARARPGRLLRVGEVRLEITAEPHLGCKKFSARFGEDALSWVNDAARRDLRLRGIHARVVRGGHVQQGDVCAWDDGSSR